MYRLSLYLFLFLYSLNGVSQLDSMHYLPPLHSRANTNIADHYLYLSTPESTPFQVTITNGAGTVLSTETISNGNPAMYTVGNGQLAGSPLFIPRADVYTTLTDKGLIVEGDYDFFAEIRVQANAQATSFTGKGRAAGGKIFRLGGFPQVNNGSDQNNFTVGIMSLEDNNTIDVTDYTPGVTFVEPVGTTSPASLTINLDAGETFVLTGYSDVPENLDGILGALVESTGNIVISNGNLTGTVHPTSSSRDNGADQIVPIKQLDKNHVLIEGNGSPEMERPFVIAHSNNTDVFINGAATPIATINSGEYFVVPNTNYQGTGHKNMFIQTSNPAYVYQALAGSTSPANGDLILVPPIHCRLSNTIDLIPDVDKINNSTFNGAIFITTVAGANVTINGVAQGGAEPVAGGNYETYKVTGLSGNQVISSTGSIMVGLFGYSGAVSFSGYYSGFADTPKGDLTIFNDEICQNEVDSLMFIGADGTAPYTFSYTINEDTLNATSLEIQ